uniref:Uncharacterized protein n=1 Tax=Rhizophora mucronata TaxID=61149 RepID=A0A2P2K9N2_RHIMU
MLKKVTCYLLQFIMAKIVCSNIIGFNLIHVVAFGRNIKISIICALFIFNKLGMGQFHL